jgi:4-hydroxybenzoate polyprenyltransferase
MPFALIGFVLGYLKSQNQNYLLLLFLVILCMVFARSAAMAFNRWLDRDIDAKNPRTVIREIPSGIISSSNALIFVLVNVLLFVATTYFINPLCFMLSPVALLVILGYSYTKRFTALCHIVLGIGLALAPVGAYLAVTGYFDRIPVLLGFSVLCWVAGFDIIYALQDQDFDKNNQLHSIPETFGTQKALYISKALHLLSAFLLAMVVYFIFEMYPQVGWISILSWFIFSALLIYQHSLVKVNDLSRINLAFFTTNGIASVIFGALLIFDLMT